MYDLTIIGGGPAGVAAGVYASRKQLNTLFITESFGGQSIVSDGIENWIGETKISGIDLAKKLENHLNEYAGEYVNIQKGKRVDEIVKNDDGTFTVKVGDEEYQSKAVLVATGSNRRKLPAKGADIFEHKGVMYCATCDGPLFKDRDVAIIGGGNSALEGVAQVLAYAKSVTLIHRRDEFKADPVTVESVKKDPKLTIITEAEVKEVTGNIMANGLIYTKDGEDYELKVDGIFVEIGAVPAVGFVSDLVETVEDGTIQIDPWNQRTTIEGIWAAGDCTNVLYHQNNIAAGDAVKALEDIYIWIKNNG